MNKFSKVIALTLSATMIFGSSVTAFATDPDPEPELFQESTGAGSKEGHVEKKKTSVVLPTYAADAESPFAYTMDPEGLIKETAHAKYGNAVEFPATADDKQVYFNNGKKGGTGDDKDNIVYKNSSVAQNVINKSSHDINLTVKAEVTSPVATDIPLVAAAEIEDAEAAALYLGLLVGDEAAKAVTTEAAAETTVEIDGAADNFKIAVNATTNEYEYRELTLEEYKAIEGNEDAKALSWDAATFKLEGAVTSDFDIASTTTAPSIKVTWSWTDPTEGPQVSISSDGVITMSNLTADKLWAGLSVSFTKDDAQETYDFGSDTRIEWDNTNYDRAEGGTTIARMNDAWVAYCDGLTITATLTLSDGTTVTGTGTIGE